MLASNFFVMAFYVVGDGMCVIFFGPIPRGCALNVMAAKVVVFIYYVIGLPVACGPTPAQCNLILPPTLVGSISVPALSLPPCHPQVLTVRLHVLAQFPHGAQGECTWQSTAGW